MARKILFMFTVVIILFSSFLFIGCKKKEEEKESPGYRITDKPAQSIPGKAAQAALGVECKSNLNQVRQYISMKEQDDNTYGSLEQPAYSTFAEIGVPREITHCPVSRKEYILEGNRVRCAFEGHENY